MLEKVMFVGRATVEATPGWADWSLISITEPANIKDEQVPLNVMAGWHAVERTAFFDVESDSANYPFMQMKDAIKIVQFVHQQAPLVSGMMVHCKAGISRSSAVAKWISQTYDLPFNHAYNRYNKHVFMLLNQANEILKGRIQQPDC